VAWLAILLGIAFGAAASRGGVAATGIAGLVAARYQRDSVPNRMFVRALGGAGIGPRGVDSNIESMTTSSEIVRRGISDRTRTGGLPACWRNVASLHVAALEWSCSPPWRSSPRLPRARSVRKRRP
jgi:hypothetical protein